MYPTLFYFSFVRAIAASTSRKKIAKATMDILMMHLPQMTFQRRVIHPRDIIFFTALHNVCLSKLGVNVFMSEQMAAMLFIKICIKCQLVCFNSLIHTFLFNQLVDVATNYLLISFYQWSYIHKKGRCVTSSRVVKILNETTVRRLTISLCRRKRWIWHL